MKKIIIVPNPKRDENLNTAKAVAKKFAQCCDVYMEDSYSGIENVCFLKKSELIRSDVDMVVTLGGDGTILAAVSEMVPNMLPVLGINLGHLGFLAELENGMLDEYFERIISGDYTIEKRMMIEAKIIRDNNTIGTFHSLNDIVISRGSLSRILHTAITVDGCELDNFVADGVVFSTPTGSTGYSLSAGGPIISPEVEAMLVTAISPHNMSTRPIVIPANKVIKVCVSGSEESRAYLSADGRHGVNLDDRDIIEIKKSEYETKLVKLREVDFYETVRKKLNQRGRG